LAEEGINMVATNIRAIHQPQNRRLEAQPETKPTPAGLLKYHTMFPTYHKVPPVYNNTRLIPYFNKRFNVKQPISPHFPTSYSLLYMIFAGKSRRITIKNKQEILANTF
jgi:hypothetical protein